MKKQGILIYDDVIDRMDICFGPLGYYGGLHCGEQLEVLLDGEWIPTRIELGEFWYLKGVKLIKLNGLIVCARRWTTLIEVRICSCPYLSIDNS